MSVTPGLRDSIISAKKQLAEGRAQIRQEHERRSLGIQVSAHLSELLDSVVRGIYQAALADFPRETSLAIQDGMALVAHSGYGRRDVAPYSDVDLMLLYEPGAADHMPRLAERLLRDLFDAGLDVGQSVRTIDEACQLAKQDATICTSLLEARYLTGNQRLFNQFSDRFRSHIRARRRTLFPAIEQARRDERSQFGETVYLLEPNIKRSRGGLRDIQLLRWIGYICYGEADLDNLHLLGVLTKSDQFTIRRATEYLLRLRNELHFHAGKSNDVLDKAEQMRISKLYGFQGTDGILPVEQFMSEFFGHTHAVRGVVSNFVATAKPGRKLQTLLGTFFSHQVEGDYRVTPSQIVATKRGLEKLNSELSEVLRLTDVANLYNKRIADSTWQAIRTSLPNYGGAEDDRVSQRFLSLISQPARLAELLHRLHELGVLEKIIPAFAHAKSLLQFNEYHKYTVDEHCIRAVQAATEFLGEPKKLLGQVYRGIKQKRVLHLALLIHDLGKGFVEDHSEVGARIAEQVGQSLKLPQRETEILKFLVLKHLVMSHLAFRRDTSDDQLIVRFAVEVGSPEVLDMLYVLTAADLSAVGPGVWNDWKAEILGDLYQRTLRHLLGDTRSGDDEDRTAARVRAIRSALPPGCDDDWFDRQIKNLPHAFLFGSSPERISEELVSLREVCPGTVLAQGRYLPAFHAVEFVVGTHEAIVPGVFHRLTGALASHGLQILSAQINTLADGLILDRFTVVDPDFSEAPPKSRIDEVTRSLEKSLRVPQDDPPTFRKVWQSSKQKHSADLGKLPPRALADNNTSDRYTILDIFATDRLGLLYMISRTLFEQGLSVSLAKIGTYLDQVVDVFYVTDQAGSKIQDEKRLQEITTRLLSEIESLEKKSSG
jgi:[protein-PII] uridylyltransferase